MWTDSDLICLMALSFLVGLSLAWFIRTVKSL